jgi:hypothetical protein
MSWYYQQVSENAGVDPKTNDGFLGRYRFYEYTDATKIAQINADISRMNSDTNGKPGTYGPFATLAEAQSAATTNAPETLQQSIDSGTLKIPVISQAADIASGALTFLGALTDPHTWLRIAEVILGLVLIGVGIAKLTNAVPIATKTAAQAAKIGAMFA